MGIVLGDLARLMVMHVCLRSPKVRQNT